MHTRINYSHKFSNIFFLLHHFLAGKFLFDISNDCVTSLELTKVVPVYTMTTFGTSNYCLAASSIIS